MRRNPMKNSNRRIKYVLCTFFSFLFLLIVKLFFLQIFPTEEVISQYTNNQSEVVMDQRYQVFDVNNKDLVNYKINYIVVFDNKPFQLNNYNGNLEELLTLNYIMKEEYSDFNFTDVIKNIGKTYYKISEESYNKISKLLNLKGVYLYTSKEADIQRFYNIGNYIMSIDQSKDYESGTLEAHIKDVMKENDFPRRDFVLNNDSTYKDDGINNIDSNKNIRLTIDKSIEEKITKVLKREEFKDIKNAGVILLESKTGKVKAMVQKNNDEANVNLCVNSMGYEPGSIYKLITLGVALDKGLISMHSEFTCTGNICNYKSVHGNLNLSEALVKSCNDVFGKVGSMVGYENLIEYSKNLGLYERVLGLSEETKGTIPKVTAGMNNISIGQCFTVSPIQIIGACNAIVNNGVYVKPKIVQSIFSKDGIFEDYNIEERKVFDETSALLIKDSMIDVVTRGTGKLAQVQNVTIGGKTGTANSFKENTVHGWFFGYFTIDDVEYSMLVFVPDIDNSNNIIEYGGGNTASPIFKGIVDELI